MAVGIRIRGVYGQLQISDESPVNSVLFQGNLGAMHYYGSPGADGYVAGINFPATITTTEQPLVFLRITNNVRIYCVRVVGSPGAWTGFRVFASDGAQAPGWNSALVPVYGTWFITTTQAAKSSAKYGIRIRNNTTGAIVFDSGYPIAKFLSWQAQFTNYRVISTGYDSGGIGGSSGMYWDWIKLDASIPYTQNAHFLANSYTGMVAGGTYSHPSWMQLFFNSGAPGTLTIDANVPSGQGPSIFVANAWNLVWATPGP